MEIVSKYKIWFSISLVIMIIGLGIGLVSGLNLGIDFSGGTMMQIDIGRSFETDEVRTVLEPFNLKEEIIHAGMDKTEVIIRTKESLNNDARKEIFSVIKEAFTLEDEAYLGTEQFGPAIGDEIRRRAMTSIIFASIGMLIYITLRFEITFGISSIIALLHDVLILISIYAIFRIPVDTSFIAAVLTIVGYSINDTIVVFDRIRFNIRFLKRNDYMSIAEMSVQQTLTRSINTSLTTLLVIGSLYFLGVESIKNFALPLLAGVITGTYSSIFIASPVWALWKTRSKRSEYVKANM